MRTPSSPAERLAQVETGDATVHELRTVLIDAGSNADAFQRARTAIVQWLTMHRDVAYQLAALHPNSDGYTEMGDRWQTALDALQSETPCAAIPVPGTTTVLHVPRCVSHNHPAFLDSGEVTA